MKFKMNRNKIGIARELGWPIAKTPNWVIEAIAYLWSERIDDWDLLLHFNHLASMRQNLDRIFSTYIANRVTGLKK